MSFWQPQKPLDINDDEKSIDAEILDFELDLGVDWLLSLMSSEYEHFQGDFSSWM